MRKKVRFISHAALLAALYVALTYGQNMPREIDYNGTKIINAYERYVIEIPDRPVPAKKMGQVIYKTRFRQNYLDGE